MQPTTDNPAGECAQGKPLSAKAALERCRIAGRKGAARDLAPYVTGARRFTSGDAFTRSIAYTAILEVMFSVSRVETITRLTSEAMDPANPAFRSVLIHLKCDAESVPDPYPQHVNGDAVWSAYDAMRARKRKAKFHDQVVGMLLILGAFTDPQRAAEEIKILQPEARKSESLPELLRHAKRVCRDIPSPEALVQRLYDGKLKLKPDAMAVVEAYSMHRFVLGDGLEGYLSDMGEKWTQAHKGLLIVGKTKAAEALAVAAEHAFRGKRVRNRAEVDRATAHLLETEKAWDDFVKVCDRYWQPGESVPRAIERYIAAHADSFRAR